MGNILITGCKGQLGTQLMLDLKDKTTELGPVDLFKEDYSFTGIDVDTLDITDYNAVDAYVKDKGFTCIINCAAFTNVNACESKEDLAYQVNKVGPENLAKVAQKYGMKFVHISTDYVFRGDGKRPYMEMEASDPVSAGPRMPEKERSSITAVIILSFAQAGCTVTTATISLRP